jgi:hypothetical protein
MSEQYTYVANHRFVACLDILGFKALLKRFGTERLAAVYARARDLSFEEKLQVRDVQTIIKEFEESLFGSIAPTSSKTTTVAVQERIYTQLELLTLFSDSIFIFTRDRSNEAFDQLVRFSNILFQIFLALGLPIRGGIGEGVCVIDANKEIYLGNAIVQAYLLEQSLDIIGIAIHENIELPSLELVNAAVSMKSGQSQNMRIARGTVTDPASREEIRKGFIKLEEQAPSHLKRRYELSRPIVSIMVTGVVDELFK